MAETAGLWTVRVYLSNKTTTHPSWSSEWTLWEFQVSHFPR